MNFINPDLTPIYDNCLNYYNHLLGKFLKEEQSDENDFKVEDLNRSLIFVDKVAYYAKLSEQTICFLGEQYAFHFEYKNA